MNFLKLIYSYASWNTDEFSINPSYKKPSIYSVLEFLQNNYEDLSNDEKLKNKILDYLKLNYNFIHDKEFWKSKKLLESVNLKYEKIKNKLENIYDSISKFNTSNIYDFNRTKQIDKNSWIYVEDLLKKENWIGISNIGEKANTALFLVVQRQSLNNREKWIVELKKSVDKNESPSQFLRMMEDRIQLDLGKSQLFGTQFIQNKNSKYFNVKSKFKNLHDMKKFTDSLTESSLILNFNEFMNKNLKM